MEKLLFIVIFNLSLCYSQKNDFRIYHTNINKAEELFFMEQKSDSALYYYDKTFTSFDFIFAKDLVNAAQIALFSKKPFLKYIEKAFDYGLKLELLEDYPLFKKILPTLKKDKKLLEKYKIARLNYLKKIDFDYLDWLYKIAIKDQKDKRKKFYQYTDVIRKTTNSLLDLTLKKGFPGDRIIGLSDSLIFKEIKKPWLDLYEQRKNDSTLFYMNLAKNLASTEYNMVLLVHNPCSYFLYKDILLKEMINGNMHPREIGLIYDNTYRFIDISAYYCKLKDLKGVYRLNTFTDYSKQNNITQTNEMRKKLYIVSTFIDEKKKEYEKKYGFVLFTGFWSCR